MSIDQPKEVVIDHELPLVFIDSIHFSNSTLDNSAKFLGKNDYHHVSQEFDADVLHLVKKKIFFLVTTGTPLKNLRKFT